MLVLFQKAEKESIFVTFQFNHKIRNKLTGNRELIYSCHNTITSPIFYHVTLLVMNYILKYFENKILMK